MFDQGPGPRIVEGNTDPIRQRIVGFPGELLIV